MHLFCVIFSPIMLDPANPTNNVCYMYWKEKKAQMESAAQVSLQFPLLRDVIVQPNWRG